MNIYHPLLFRLIYNCIIIEIFPSSNLYVNFIKKIRHKELNQKANKRNILIALANQKTLNMAGDLFNDQSKQ